MAILNKKLKITSNGQTINHNIYTTTAECNNLYAGISLDGIIGYIPLGAVGGGNTSAGRVTKGNNTYALKTIAKPLYTEKSWTTAGTYTWTCPAEVYRVRVALCAGGGGQICSVTFGNNDVGKQVPSGENSSFDSLITAFAGYGGYVEKYKHGGDHVRYSYRITGRKNGSPIVTNESIATAVNGNGTYTQTYGWKCSFNQEQELYGFGSSGESYLYYGHSDKLILGSNGGYNTGYVNVVPYKTYQITVGKGGGLLENNKSANIYGSIGGTEDVVRPSKCGFVLIAFGGDI